MKDALIIVVSLEVGVMVKRSILKFLVCLAFGFAGQTFAVESDDLLQPDDAFQFTAKVNKTDQLLLSWE
jgi:hypothetical protein